MRKCLVSLLFMVLAGCVGLSGLTPQQEIAASCKIYISTLNVMTALKHKMTHKQIDSVNAVIKIAHLTCTGEKPGKDATWETAVAIESAVNILQHIRGEMK